MQQNGVHADLDDDAVRLAFRHTWGEVFIHAYEAKGPETNSERERRMDALLSRILWEDDEGD